jgi:Flp pilus assembly protein TadG
MRGYRHRSREATARRGFLSRLRADEAGNTLAIAAAALLPLIGLVGGGVDMSRIYIVKTRLQHACDAGALAGRKAMGAGVWSYDNYAAREVADGFFDANIQADPYGATDLTRNFTEDAGKVVGTASATVPMALMQIFGIESRTLTVSCDAEMRLPNTDVMFVLDVTGSMGGKAKSSDSETKIQGLRTAVKCFYEIIARLDTNADCSQGQPSGGTGDQVQIRFGFVPYNTNVNVGRLLPTSYLADQWTYQSREPKFILADTWVQVGSPETEKENVSYKVDSRYCNDTDAATLNRTEEEIDDDEREVREYIYDAEYYKNGRCYGTVTIIETEYERRKVRKFDEWRYAPIKTDISGLKNGLSWNGSIQLPIGEEGKDTTVVWDGCIEERQTVRQANYNPIPLGAKDLDIDLVPNKGAANSLWGPALWGAIYPRQNEIIATGDDTNYNANEIRTKKDFQNNTRYVCPAESRKLQEWPAAGSFSAYVDGLQPNGNTYHDIGLLWGSRLLSPTGIFKEENEFTSRGGDIERHLIFMTDGDTVTNRTNYAAYGLPWFDRRQTPTGRPPTNAELTDQVNARFEAICTAVKNKNITLWVISFGSGSNSATEARLQSCASANRYFVARDSAALQQTFRSIADEISQLRLTR